MLLALIRDERGSNSVELTYVLTALLLLTFAIFDFASASFNWDAAEKAAQVGVREAVIRDPIALPITSFFQCEAQSNKWNSAYVGYLCSDPSVPSDNTCDFGTVTCTSTGCTRNGTALASTKVNQTTFNNIVAAMQTALPRLKPANVSITYRPTTLGFVGKPNGPIPEVTVQVSNVPFYFRMLYLLWPNFNLTIPTQSVSFTGEDLSDNTCAEQGLVDGTDPNGNLVCQKGGGGGGGGTPVCF
jgi:Flp pilus assembly protein TadG